MSAKPHRTVAFLLIVALMSSVSLYPIVTSRSFEDKAVRGAKVQIGTDWQVLYNAPDLIDVDRLNGPAGTADRGDQAGDRQAARLARGVDGVRDATYMVESVLPSFYLPGYGLRGVPLYLLANPDDVPRDRLLRAERRAERSVRGHHGAHEPTKTSPCRRRLRTSGGWTPERRFCSASTRSAARPRRTQPASSRSCPASRPRASATARATCRRASTISITCSAATPTWRPASTTRS